MIHSAVLGSLELFFGVLIEHIMLEIFHFGFVQHPSSSFTSHRLQYCNELTRKLKASGIRAEVCKLI
ncbi:hypothetical protein LOK49_LG07G02669 [Camellia lanceoleosa]|uniref:Uncharacterized protein n=1 Tax=Camellia lanceoleosa TaxID=1840588 RepID=A0ACC0H4M9_9ERIC|nr:hypothetical protein LOK49_LG07G02669 [Camellia lanceoleosa]